MKCSKTWRRSALYLAPLSAFFMINGCSGSSGGGGCGQQGGQTTCGQGTHPVYDGSGNATCVPNK